jgi:hypothetical protein
MKLKFRNIGLYLILVTTLTTLITCSSEYEQWQAEAITMAKSANDITQDEYENLVDIIQSSPDDFRIFLNDDKSVNHKKLHENLITFFASKKLEISPDKIYSPVNSTKISEVSKFNVNVFLENSASMDGYVQGRTDFEAAIFNLLVKIKRDSFCDSLNLNYINDNVLKWAPVIEDFIDRLEPETFRRRGGNRSTSDLSKVIKTVANSVNKQNASLLISDFVFSPGGQRNASPYLSGQSSEIELSISEILKNINLSVVVLHLESKFNGQYYDLSDQPHNYDGRRPYYIWVIGTDEQVKQILASNILDNIQGGVQHKLVFYNVGEPKKIDFKIARSPKIGTFEVPNGGSGPIVSASYDDNRNKGVFGFAFYANFNNEMQNSSFYLDKNNYKWNKNYELEISTISDPNDLATSGYTHMFKVETKELKSETFTLEVIGKTPDWVNSISSENDSGINPGNDQASKTYGFKYLIDGVSEAFYPNNKINITNKLEITIKR